jgi:hypothetical protein
MSESNEQQAVVEWYRLQYPKQAKRLIAIPNGQWIAGQGKRKFALINKYKAEGWLNGVSDLLLAWPISPYSGLWLEMKDRGKTKSSLSTEQREWLSEMREAGYRAEWAAGFEEAKKIIEEYLQACQLT